MTRVADEGEECEEVTAALKVTIQGDYGHDDIGAARKAKKVKKDKESVVQKITIQGYSVDDDIGVVDEDRECEEITVVLKVTIQGDYCHDNIGAVAQGGEDKEGAV